MASMTISRSHFALESALPIDSHYTSEDTFAMDEDEYIGGAESIFDLSMIHPSHLGLDTEGCYDSDKTPPAIDLAFLARSWNSTTPLSSGFTSPTPSHCTVDSYFTSPTSSHPVSPESRSYESTPTELPSCGGESMIRSFSAPVATQRDFDAMRDAWLTECSGPPKLSISTSPRRRGPSSAPAQYHLSISPSAFIKRRVSARCTLPPTPEHEVAFTYNTTPTFNASAHASGASTPLVGTRPGLARSITSPVGMGIPPAF